MRSFPSNASDCHFCHPLAIRKRSLVSLRAVSSSFSNGTFRLTDMLPRVTRMGGSPESRKLDTLLPAVWTPGSKTRSPSCSDWGANHPDGAGIPYLFRKVRGYFPPRQRKTILFSGGNPSGGYLANGR